MIPEKHMLSSRGVRCLPETSRTVNHLHEPNGYITTREYLNDRSHRHVAIEDDTVHDAIQSTGYWGKRRRHVDVAHDSSNQESSRFDEQQRRYDFVCSWA